MCTTTFLPFFAAGLLQHAAALSLQRQVSDGDNRDNCSSEFVEFWEAPLESTELWQSVVYIKSHECFKEETLPTPSPTPAPTPCDSPTCELWADPHVSGFDNTELHAPDNLFLASHIDKANISHGGKHNITFTTRMRTFDQRPVDVNALDAGDFWLVKNPAVFIQGRFRLAQEFLPDNAAIGAVAIGGPFLDGDRIVVEPLDGQVLLNAFAMPSGNMSMQTTSGNISTLHYARKKSHKHTDSSEQQQEEHADVSLELPKDVKMVIRRWKRHLDVQIKMPKLPGGVDGECGNMNGIPDDDTEHLIQKRMKSLKVPSKRKLFVKSFNLDVRLDEDGFTAVQKAKHPRQAVKDFIHALLANSEAQVLSEGDLSGLVQYYDGQISQKSYRELLSELQTVPWVQGFEPPKEENLFQMAMHELNDLFR